MDEEREDIFSVARLRLMVRKPYLASAAYRLRPFPNAEIPTAAIDSSWRVYYNPQIWESWTADQCAAVLEHELWHVVRCHGPRAIAIQAQSLLWNLAADAEIHHDQDLYTRLPIEGVSPKMMKSKEGATAEEMYKKLLKNKTEFKVTFLPVGGEGSGVTGEKAPFEQDQDSNAPGRAETEGIRREIAKEVERENAKKPGTIPADILRWAGEVLAVPKVPWKKELAGAVRRAIADVIGAVDYSFSRPNRRYRGSDIILPRLRQPVPQVGIVFDTSGSMGKQELEDGLSEVEGVCKTTGAEIFIIAVDADVHGKKKIMKAKDVQLHGGGGTDMRIGIKALEDTRPRPDIGIVLTDGFTPWPDSPSRLRLITVLLGKGHAAPETVPGFIRTIERDSNDDSSTDI